MEGGDLGEGRDLGEGGEGGGGWKGEMRKKREGEGGACSVILVKTRK